jgi:hypothetical protein
MTSLCHNCRNAIPEGSAYCPECGAPRLKVQSSEAREAELSVLAANAGEKPIRHTGDIAWPAALRVAALFSVPAGALLSFFTEPSLLEMLLVGGGAMWTTRRYRKVAPGAPGLTPQLGGRIGLLVAVLVLVVSKAGEALRFVLERYGMHRGATIDAQLQSYVQPEIAFIKASNPDAAAQLAVLSHFWASAEGRAFMLLFFVASSAAWMLFAGWLSGRFSVRFPRPPRSQP